MLEKKIKYLAANSATYYSCHCGNLSGINLCSYMDWLVEAQALK